MVIPDIDLWDLAVGRRKRSRIIPAEVVLEIVIVALGTKLLWEGVLLTLLGVAYVRPSAQGAVDSDAIVVDLVTTSHHDVERRSFMLPHNVVPQAWTAPGLLIGADAEAIAGVEHDAHRLVYGGDEEAVDLRLVAGGESQLWHLIFVTRLLGLERHADAECPEGVAFVGIQTLTIDPGLSLSAANSSQRQRGVVKHLLATALGYNENTAKPVALIHSTIVEKRSAHDLSAI